MAGNLFEWTMEGFSSGSRVLRGGSLVSNATRYPLVTRNLSNCDYVYAPNGFRAALYIK